TVRRLDREGLAARRHGPGEADDAGRGREHGRTAVRADRDAAVLPGSIRMRRIEGEGLEHRPLDGPRPGAGAQNEEQEQKNDRAEPPHGTPPLVVGFENRDGTVAAASAVVHSAYREPL